MAYIFYLDDSHYIQCDSFEIRIMGKWYKQDNRAIKQVDFILYKQNERIAIFSDDFFEDGSYDIYLNDNASVSHLCISKAVKECIEEQLANFVIDENTECWETYCDNEVFGEDITKYY